MKKIQRHQNGQAMVEFALIIPLLVLVLMGIFDLGLGIYSYNVVASAAREGARYGTLQPTNTSGIQTQTTANTAGLDPSRLSTPTVECLDQNLAIVTCTTDYRTSPYIRVSVTYTYQPLTIYFWPLSFTGKSMMAVEP